MLAIGASLSAALAAIDRAKVLPLFEQDGVFALVENARRTILDASSSGNSPEQKKLDELQNWSAHLEQCVMVLKGEDVPSFDRLARI